MDNIQHFYIVARLQAMATFRIRFSLPKHIFYSRYEEVGLANTGSNSKHSKTPSTQMKMVSNGLLRAEKMALGQGET